MLIVKTTSLLSTLNRISYGSIFRLLLKKSQSVLTMDRKQEGCRRLEEFGCLENSYRKYLVAEDSPMMDGSKHRPHNVKGAHISNVLPEPVSNPYLIANSVSCADSLNLCTSELTTPQFVSLFSGNILLPGVDQPFCTNYGCHSFGTWFGQLGDGRAILLGETYTNQEDIYSKWDGKHYYTLGMRELQLKGSGRSPYSRGFDGRAVLRSSVREFLASEAMHHLGVPTTRALTLIGTGQTLLRPWYGSTSQFNPYAVPLEDLDNSLVTPSQPHKFPPDQMIREPGAIVCRVARSFLRFGHLELFAKRQEWSECLALLDFVCLKEYPHLLQYSSEPADSVNAILQSIQPTETTPTESFVLPDHLPTGSLRRYIELYRCIVHQVAKLVVEWWRVGFVEGNMNSDNTLLSGMTVDYGPFGFQEAYDPQYQPFTTDRYGNFAFNAQPEAMAMNVKVLGETVFLPLMKHLCSTTMTDNPSMYYTIQAEVMKIMVEEYDSVFQKQYQEMLHKKLGLLWPSSNSEANKKLENDKKLYEDALDLMHKSQCDYTIFFRQLSQYHPDNMTNEVAIKIIVQRSMLNPDDLTSTMTTDWQDWFIRYAQRLQQDHWSDPTLRIVSMNKTNPKYILRNWMNTMAYEQAQQQHQQQDYTMIETLLQVLSKPYEEQGLEEESQWYQVTPNWARQLPGVTFMSCSS